MFGLVLTSIGFEFLTECFGLVLTSIGSTMVVVCGVDGCFPTSCMVNEAHAFFNGMGAGILLTCLVVLCVLVRALILLCFRLPVFLGRGDWWFWYVVVETLLRVTLKRAVCVTYRRTGSLLVLIGADKCVHCC